jgi:hypothetical protein
MTDTLSLDDTEYKVTNMCRNNTVASTTVTYKNFDVPKNREVHWDDKGLYGPDMYYVVPLRETFADVVTHNSRMLGPHLPKAQETVVPTQSVEQVQEKTYHHKGPHNTEPTLRRRKYPRYRSHSAKNPLHTGKPNHRSRSPGELDREYHQEYEFGFSDNDHYYKPEIINEENYWYYFGLDYTYNEDGSCRYSPHCLGGYNEDGSFGDYNEDGSCNCPHCCWYYNEDADYDPYNEDEFEYRDCSNCGEILYTDRDGNMCAYCGN